MKLTTRGRSACAVWSWIGAFALLTMAPQVMAQTAPIAEAGSDFAVADTDGADGEDVTLDGSGSYDPDSEGGGIVSYEWFRIGGHGVEISLGITMTPYFQTRLADGGHNILLEVTDNSGETATDTVFVTVNGSSATPPTANAGADRVVNDADNAAGESVVLDGSGSFDPDGNIVSYAWSLYIGDGTQPLGTSLTPAFQTRLPDGVNTIYLVVTDNAGQTAEDTVLITVNAPVPLPPTASAGADRSVNDSNGAAGENVQLDGTASTDPDGTIVSYEWSRFNGEGYSTLGTGATLQASLPDGASTIRLVVTDNSGLTAEDTVLITVNPPVPLPPTANAGADRTINDADGAAGENVQLDGTASSDPDGTIASYEWSLFNGEGYSTLGSGATLQTRLPNGQNTVRLVVTDNTGLTAEDTVVITVNPPAPLPPTANAGADRAVNDTDGADGENVQLDGSASSDPDGTIASYEWSLYNGEGYDPLGTGATLQARLPDGENTVRLVVTDNTGLTAEDTVVITVNAPGQVPPTANAGADRTINDTDGADGENVQLDGSASTDPDGSIISYEWSLYNGEGYTLLGSGVTLQARLPDGENTVRLVVTDSSELSTEDTVVITVNPAAPLSPIANAGPDRSVNDTDAAEGEDVQLDGSASTDPDGTIVNYEWILLQDEGSQNLGSSASPTLPARLPDGANNIRLIVTDNTGLTAEDTVVITVNIASATAPTANAGADRTINDTDQQPGENVVLDGSTSVDPDGTIINYTWTREDGESTQQLGSGVNPTLQVRLPDGENVIRLTVTDNAQNTAEDTVVITVGEPVPVAPTANAGADRTIADTDGEDGESVVLDGSGSTDPDGTIANYAWIRLDGETPERLGTSTTPTLQARLPDGENIVQLVVTDNTGNTATDTVVITVNEVVITTLSNIPGLTPNQKSVAQALDRICMQLRDQSGGEAPQLSADQQDLLARCDGLQMNNTTANQVSALDELVADDFSIARTQTLLFANTLYAGVMDRLMALRGGAKGLSLAGLNIIVDGKPVPLAQLQDMAKGLLGGGASADEPGGLLNDKWGLWARGNYSFGEKDRSANGPAFESNQWAMVGGVDYRYNDRIVGGLSLAYGQSSIDLDAGQGGLETDSWAASLYGSSYVAKKFYFDAIVNIANSDYGADRNIAYVDGAGLVDVDARGDTSGMTYSAGVSGGRDFLYGGLTVSPTLGLFYIDATIDSFTERGAGGLNLIYDEQSFQSFTGNLGFRVTYAWNLTWGVLLPHLRVDYVREFKDDVDVFGVRFAADPNATSAPPILVATDNPDESYWRLATGVSAQFIEGISGYVEYQRLQSFEFISFQDLSLGLRFQKSF